MFDASVDIKNSVFGKTAIGQQEITSKTLRLGPTVRRVLILIDGKRNGAELASLISGADLADLLDQLHTHACIELLHTGTPVEVAPPPVATEKAASPESPSAAAQSVLAQLPPPESRTAKDVEMARNFMTNTVNTVFQQNSRLTLIEAIFACKTGEDVRRVYLKWEETMGASVIGAKRLPEFRLKLMRVL